MNELERKFHENYLSYLKEGYNDEKIEMLNKRMSCVHVKAWIKHLPTRKNEGWSEEIYKFCEQFLQELYQYSKEMGYIADDITFEQFIEE